MSEPDEALESAAGRLFKHLDGAVVRSLRRQDSIAVAASGGLDSSVLAALLARHSDVPIQLVTVSAPGAVDAQRARALAVHLRLPLAEVVLTRRRVESILAAIVPLVGLSPVDPDRAAEWGVSATARYVSPIMVSFELPVFAAAEEARRFARRLVVGQGADEYLGGYARYETVPAADLAAALARDQEALEKDVLPVEARIAARHTLTFHYPYLDARVKTLCRSLPPSALVHEGVRKRVLRRVAQMLDLPAQIVDVPKTAAQYGTGVAGILKGLADEAGVHQNEFLTRFLDHRRIGEPHSLRT